MHEVALSTQLAAVVRRAAAGRRVRVVHLEVGQLRQVVPASFEYAWRFVSAGTELDGAELDTRWIPVRLRCSCGFHGEMGAELNLCCPRCGEPAEILSGEEFRVVDIEVEGPATALS
ncbi:hydrogenase maturation nickel metallochaperone HypA [Corynebacterium sp. TAE3-ERU30]|uniref:hydrogenase maturation nickel metallochaperone HypA n=1 Tax=Corynebacterium sp. TAE3-ERU30 TaxID=2849496 RepID=UPI001C44F09B|nr:hydrogenase maturation nickel metallochaperone HypA [Corynebacterium sp. TAE3-ERU30]